MTIKEQIFKVLELYQMRQYTTDVFCKVFNELYHYEAGGYKYFKGKTKKYLNDLASVTERYSQFEEDIQNYPNTYFSVENVEEKFQEIYSKLKF